MFKKKSIVFLGFSDFPYGFAEAQRIILISKCLLLKGNTVTVICRNGSYRESEKPELKVHDFYDNIEYIYVSGSCFRNQKFTKRRLLEIKGKTNEFLLLRRRKKENKLDFAILSTRSFSSIIYYYLLSKWFRFKIILNYVEYYSAMRKNKFQITQRLNDRLFDKYAPSLSGAVFPISEFLINRIKKRILSKKYIKIPILTDLNRFNDIEIINNQKYFLFCGSAGYMEIIKFIIDSFELLNNSSYDLYLVINGSKKDMAEIHEYIQKQPTKEKIKIFSKLAEKELFTYYYNATALLIPLRDTLQDRARFPHKVGEYLASGNPVISTDYGEIHYYFKDLKDMLLANTYDKYSFAEKMQFVINNPNESKNIGLRGKEIVYKKFQYRSVAETLNEFLNEL